MLDISKVRITEVKTPNGEWVTTNWELVEVGDVIRFREPDGVTIVVDPDGRSEFRVYEMPSLKVEPCEVPLEVTSAATDKPTY